MPYNPQASSSTAGLDPKTSSRIEKIESVLSILVRHTPGVGGYEAIQQWSASKFLNFSSQFCKVCQLTLSAPAYQDLMSNTPSAPASPSFTHPPLVAMPMPAKREIAGPATLPEVDGVGGGSDDGLGGKAGKGWLGDLDG